MPSPCFHDPNGELSCRCDDRYAWVKKEHAKGVAAVNVPKNLNCKRPLSMVETPATEFTASCSALSDYRNPKPVIERVECVACHSKSFEVFVGDYWTGIRCNGCGIESTIHDG